MKVGVVEDTHLPRFAHSHRPLCESRGSVWLVDPGFPTDKRSQPRYFYAILDIERGRVRPRLVFYVDRLT
jgi:predicted phosphodiesterase